MDRVEKYASAIRDARAAFNMANEQCTSEDIRAMAISMCIEEDRSKSSNKGNYQQQPANLGNCKDCGAPNKWSKRANKPYCGAKCWDKSAQQNNQGGDIPY